MNADYDVIVAGLGIHGACIVRELARRGFRVLGLDALHPPHDRGSSHGRTRIIREAYYEDPLYVPLVRRAFDQWAGLEQQTGERLFLRTGAIMIGPEDGVLVSGTLESVRAHDLPHERLDAKAIRSRFPALCPTDDMVGILEERAGMLMAERCHEAVLALAAADGAMLRFDEPVDHVAENAGGIAVRTNGARYTSRHCIIAAGAWTPALLAKMPAPPVSPRLDVERQVVGFFAPSHERASVDAARCPVAMFEQADGSMFYALPDAGDGLKAAMHHGGTRCDPDSVDRIARPADIATVRDAIDRWMPRTCSELVRATICLYTNTADGHFLIDRHPALPAALIVSACSGHGFKFGPALAEMVAMLIEGDAAAVTAFRWRA